MPPSFMESVNNFFYYAVYHAEKSLFEKNAFKVLRECQVAGFYLHISRYSNAYNSENFTNFKKFFLNTYS